MFAECIFVRRRRGQVVHFARVVGKPEQLLASVALGIHDILELIPNHNKPFPVNVDGGTFMAKESMLFERVGKIPLIAN